jgi:hypothetical protein
LQRFLIILAIIDGFFQNRRCRLRIETEWVSTFPVTSAHPDYAFLLPVLTISPYRQILFIYFFLTSVKLSCRIEILQVFASRTHQQMTRNKPATTGKKNKSQKNRAFAINKTTSYRTFLTGFL